MARKKVLIPWMIAEDGSETLPHYGVRADEEPEEETVPRWTFSYGEARLAYRDQKATHRCRYSEQAPVVGVPTITGAGRGRSAAYLDLRVVRDDGVTVSGALSIHHAAALFAGLRDGRKRFAFNPRKMGQNYLFEVADEQPC